MPASKVKPTPVPVSKPESKSESTSDLESNVQSILGLLDDPESKFMSGSKGDPVPQSQLKDLQEIMPENMPETLLEIMISCLRTCLSSTMAQRVNGYEANFRHNKES